jgi:hypothetical protein
LLGHRYLVVFLERQKLGNGWSIFVVDVPTQETVTNELQLDLSAPALRVRGISNERDGVLDLWWRATIHKGPPFSFSVGLKV